MDHSIEEVLDLLKHSLDEGIIHFNMEGQRHLLGLPAHIDDVRQALVNARAALTGTVHVGNLTRSHEAHKWVEKGKRFRSLFTS